MAMGYVGWDLLDELWARPSDLTENQAMKLAYDELHACRAEQRLTGRAPAGEVEDPLAQFAGTLTGTYGPGYLEQLRGEWD
jgi:hypothetical protein